MCLSAVVLLCLRVAVFCCCAVVDVLLCRYATAVFLGWCADVLLRCCMLHWCVLCWCRIFLPGNDIFKADFFV